MAVHGFGSVSSPIVISDDEDEAFVELELAERLSTPLDEDLDYQDNTYGMWDEDQLMTSVQPLAPSLSHNVFKGGSVPSSTKSNGHVSNGFVTGSVVVPGSVAGHKRKWSEDDSVPLVFPPASAKTNGVPTAISGSNAVASTSAPATALPGESKTARKKRRKRERLAAEAQANGVGTAAPTFMSSMAKDGPPPMTNGKSAPLPSLQPMNRISVAPLPVKPQLLPSQQVPPVSNGSSLPLPRRPPPPPMSNVGYLFPFVPMVPPPPVMHPRPPPSVVNPLPPPPLPPPPIHVPPPPHHPHLAPKKPIGMSPDPDPHSKHGVYHTSPEPDPSRTVVLELLPKKFRQELWVRSWAARFSSDSALRVEVDVKLGKALVEFPTANQARAAWGSNRMLSGEGKEHIRVWWYRIEGSGAGAGQRELEEGEIEEGEIEPKHVKKKAKRGVHIVHDVSKPWKDRAKSPSPASPAAQQRESRASWMENAEAGPSRPVQKSEFIASGSAPLPSLMAGSASSYGALLHDLLNMAQQVDGSAVSTLPMLPVPYGLPSAAQRRSPAPVDEPMDLGSDDGYAVHGDMPDLELSYPEEPLEEAEAAPDADGDHQSIASSRPASPCAPEEQPSVTPDTSITVETGPPPALTTPEPPATLPSIQPMPVLAPVPRSSQTSLPLAFAFSEAKSSPPPTAQAPIRSVVSAPSSTTSSIPSSALTPSAGLEPALSPSVSEPTPTRTTPVFTPTPPPSEPRAMKDLPKGPSYTKRSLLARQKELEVRIARTKEQLAASRSTTSTPVLGPAVAASVEQTPVATPTPDYGANVKETVVSEPDKVAMEHELRRLVLGSRKAKTASIPSAQADDATVHDASSAAPTPASVSGMKTIVSKGSTITQDTLNLDDLAVSFITETISTVSSPSSLPPRPSLMSSRSSEIVALAEKQKLLEQYIALSKDLMARVSSARSKEEKETILNELKERRREMEEKLKAYSATSTPAPSRDSNAKTSYAPPPKARWPETSREDCVLMISDDEEDDED